MIYVGSLDGKNWRYESMDINELMRFIVYDGHLKAGHDFYLAKKIDGSIEDIEKVEVIENKTIVQKLVK